MYYKLPIKPIQPDVPYRYHYYDYDEEIEDKDILTSQVEIDLYRGSGTISFNIDLESLKEIEVYKQIPEDHSDLTIKCIIDVDDGSITNKKIRIDYNYTTDNELYDEQFKEYTIKKEKYDKDLLHYEQEVIRLTPLIAEQDRVNAIIKAERRELDKRYNERRAVLYNIEDNKKKIEELNKIIKQYEERLEKII